MAIVYYPSCRFKEFLPKTNLLIESYMQEKYDAVIAGCCRPHHPALSNQDIAVTICNTCQAIALEDSPAKVKSVWELVAADASFTFRHYNGRRMALQDCWRSRGCHGEHDAVREILKRMEVTFVDLQKNRDEADFCGTTLLAPLPEQSARFAPRRFIEGGAGYFVPKNQSEQYLAMVEHCRSIAEAEVVCYCVPCTKGIQLGGKTAFHLAELVFGGGPRPNAQN